MEQFVVKGGNPIVGEVEIGGAKNAALAILAASIMTDETVTIDNLPDVRDINIMLDALSDIGAVVERVDRHTARINGSTIGQLHRIICWVHCLVNTKRRKWHCRVDASSEAVRLICM